MPNETVAHETHDVWIPADIAEAVLSRVGHDGFSAYVADAVARRLAHDAAEEAGGPRGTDGEVGGPASNPGPARRSS